MGHKKYLLAEEYDYEEFFCILPKKNLKLAEKPRLEVATVGPHPLPPPMVPPCQYAGKS